jgi:hypothetical protein
MHFNADEYLEVIEIPKFTIYGRTYEGQFLSLEEYLPFVRRLDKFAKLDNGEIKDPVEIAKLEIEYEHLRLDFFRAIFPKKWIYFVYGDPVEKIQKLPFKDKIFGNFFGLCGAAINPKSLAEKKKMDGMNSPNKTKESKKKKK